MFNKKATTALQDLTKKWMKDADFSQVNDVDELRNVLRFHEYRYYILHEPLISDGEYDKLFKLLEAYEKQYPEMITADSPTQRISGDLIKDFPKVQHLVPMLSLQNSYNEEDLKDWDRKARELSGLDEIEYCVEPKFDGASISVVYENDLLVKAITRGDGERGDDITPNIKRIRSLPLSAKFSDFGFQLIEIRGEVLMNKKAFEAYNRTVIENGGTPLANPRNAAAGSLRIKDTMEVGKRNLEAFLYHISYYIGKQILNAPESHSGMLEMLWDLGFRSPRNEMKIFNGINEVIAHINNYEKERDNLPYEIDGMVVKVNNLELQESLGMTSHHPRWAIAFKFKARQATSRLLSVQYQVGRTGAVTPVAKIEPVQVGGVTVSSISIHNEEYIKEKDLMLGDAILIERSGDVIPQIVKSLPELRTGNEVGIKYPRSCPVCKDKLVKSEDEAVWRCVNLNCEAQVVERIIHFSSKDAMDIRHLGEANIRKFYELGLLADIPGIYTLDFDKIKLIEGMGVKSIDNLRNAIEESKTRPIHRLIYGLGIRFVGETTAKSLAQSVTGLKELSTLNEEKLLILQDIGVKVASSIVQFFSNADNLSIVKRLENLGLQMNSVQHSTGNSLTGSTFLFTGTLQQLKRNEAEQMVEEQGGKIATSVSSKLHYLVVGEDAGSKLEKAKKLPGIRIISEEEFIKMLSI